MAIQKLGVAMPKTAKSLPKVSNNVSRFTAERIPRGTPTKNVKRKAAPANCKVAGRRCSNTSRAGRRLIRDLPKFSLMMSFRKIPYCTGKGRSKPSFFRNSSYSSWVASGSNKRLAGSPVRRTLRNMARLRINRVIIA